MNNQSFTTFLFAYLSLVGSVLYGQSNVLSQIQLGEAWSGNSVNTVIFRSQGIVTVNSFQYTAYYADSSNMVIVRRNLKTNKVECYTIEGRYKIFDSHNAISLGVDALGYVHISYDHHRSKLNYRISKIPFEISDWSEPIQMTGEKEELLSYPSFLMNPKDSTLHFMYRHGSSNSGQACLKHYDHMSKTWKDAPKAIITGYNQRPWSSNPYWNHPVFDNSGKLHISYVWRSYSVKNREISAINKIGVDYTYSSNISKNFFTTLVFSQNLPITMVNSERVYAVPTGSNLINQTSMAVDTNGFPHIVYYANDENKIPQYQHLWFDGKEWQNTIVSQRKESFVLGGDGTLKIPISRPEIVIDSMSIVYLILRADYTANKMAAIALFPPFYKYDSDNIKTLWQYSIGDAEPVVDRIRWQKENILSMLIQYNNEYGGDKKREYESTPIYIVDWDLLKMFNKNP